MFAIERRQQHHHQHQHDQLHHCQIQFTPVLQYYCCSESSQKGRPSYGKLDEVARMYTIPVLLEVRLLRHNLLLLLSPCCCWLVACCPFSKRQLFSDAFTYADEGSAQAVENGRRVHWYAMTLRSVAC